MKKVAKLFIKVLIAILILIVLWTIVHQILIRVENKNLKKSGEYVTVNGKNMNVLSVGKGEKTIVLMPGLGTTAPILDFEPLTTELQENFNVVIVEPFGCGWSDNTYEERSVDNIVEELRIALVQSGKKGPYILMPHSVSGIYAIWYANKYPDEVEAIIGIDCSLPTQTDYFEGENPHVISLAKIANPIGVQRLVCMISPLSFISDNREGLYDDENLSQQKILSNKVGFNSTVINETNAVESNICETYNMTFESTTPLLFFTRESKDQNGGKSKAGFYETYISNPTIQKVVVFDSGHYMHWTRAHEIAETVKEFILSY